MVSIASLVDAHLLPPAVSDVLGDAAAAGVSNGGGSGADTARGGSSSSYGWALHRQSLLLWRVEDGLGAVVRRLPLPEPPVGGALVGVVAHRGSSALTVVVATGAGSLFVWLDANFPAAPYAQRLFASSQQEQQQQDGADGGGSLVLALAAASASGGAGGGGSPAFVAVLATADGGLHLFHGSGAGVFPRTFHRAPPAAGGLLQAGVLGAVRSAVKSLYDEAFDPLHALARQRGSGAPARALALLPLDGGGRWKLVVLTRESLDCWLLGSLGQASSESLLWSFSIGNVLGPRLGAGELELLTMGAAVGQPREGGSGGGAAPPAGQQQQQQAVVYVWSAHTDAASLNKFQHAVSCFALDDGSSLPRLLGCAALGADARLPQPQQHMRWALAAHDRLPSCLLLAANGAVLEWARAGGGAPRLLGSSADNRALTCGGGGNWQLLSAQFGVLEFSAAGSAADAAADALARAAAAGGASAEQLAYARRLLARAVDAMAKEAAAGYPHRELAAGLADALDRMGVLAAPQGRALLLEMSAGLVDSLPKTGTLAPSQLQSTLAEKQLRHGLLLAALQVGGVLAQLPADDAAVLLQHGQQLAAAAEVLQWQRDSEAAAAGEDAEPVERDVVQAAAAAIRAAGGLVPALTAAGDDGSWAAFFGRPTASVPALFQAVAAQAAHIRQALATAADAAADMAGLEAQLLGLAGVVLTAVVGAEAEVAAQRAEMPDEARHAATAGASWLAGPGPREAWSQLAEGCLLAQHELTGLDQQLQLARAAHLPSLTALLGALAATLEQQAPPDGRLLASYKALPWEHGAVLLSVARAEVEALSESGVLQAAAVAGAAGDYSAPAYHAAKQALVWPLQQLALTHKCHQLLYEVSELVEDTGLLPPGQLREAMAREMADSRGRLAPDSFTRYVMERLLAEHHTKELLQLGQQGFQAQLSQFLAARPSLLWMSQVQTGDLAGAADSLAAAAAGCRGSVQQARRLLCLTRIAAQAAGPQAPASESLKAAAAARLAQLQLQSDVAPARDAAPPMSTQQLAQAALAAAARGEPGADGGLCGGAAAVAAVEALALDADQRGTESYQALWGDAWKAALRATPLAALAAQRGGDAAQHWSEEHRAAVEGCPLYQAFVRAAAHRARARDVSPAQELEAVANALLAEVPQAREAAVLRDVLHAAARTAGLEAA